MAEKKEEGKNAAGSSPGKSAADHGDALAALQGLANAEPIDPPAELDAPAAAQAAAEIPTGEARSGSATGFAAMLAQDGGGAASPTTAANGVHEVDSGSPSGGSKSPQAKPSPRLRQEFEELPMARMLGQKDEFTGKVTIAPPIPPPPRRRSKDSYKVLVPIMAVLGFLLLMVGMWALAAICGMSVPGMPGRHQAGYHASLMKVDFLVLALPVSLALLVMAFMMLRQLDKAHAAG